jgi:hypothetical protein
MITRLSVEPTLTAMTTSSADQRANISPPEQPDDQRSKSEGYHAPAGGEWRRTHFEGTGREVHGLLNATVQLSTGCASCSYEKALTTARVPQARCGWLLAL